MVFLTEVCAKFMPFWFRRSERKSIYFKKQALFRLTGNFGGRSRNIWRNAIQKWTKTMQYKPKYRRMRTQMISDLYSQRVLAATEEHGFRSELFLSHLSQCGVELNRKSLATLAIYEPKTFESLVNLAKTKYRENGDSEEARNQPVVDGVITRGML